MARHELILTEGEFGFDYDFNVLKEDRTAASLAAFTDSPRLVIVDPNSSNAVKLDNTANVAIVGSIVRWSIKSGQTDFNGNFVATIHLNGPSLLEKVVEFSVFVKPKII